MARMECCLCRVFTLKILCESVQSQSSEDGTHSQLPEETAQLQQLEESQVSEESIQFQAQEGSVQLLVPKENVQLQLPEETDPLQPQTICNKPTNLNWSQGEIDSFKSALSSQSSASEINAASSATKLHESNQCKPTVSGTTITTTSQSSDCSFTCSVTEL